MEFSRPIVRPRTSVVGAWLDGWRRVFGAPALIIGLVLAEAWAFQWRWTPGPAIWGPGAIGNHLAWVVLQQPYAFGGLGEHLSETPGGWNPIAFLQFGVVDIWPFAFWLAATGGALDRLARGRPIGFLGFMTATGVLFFRVLRLGALLGGGLSLLAWARFGTMGMPALLEVGRTSAYVTPFDVAVVGTAVAVIGLIGDLAAVRMVVEDRRSVLGGISAAARFVARHPAQVVVLYLANLVPGFLLFSLLVRTSPFGAVGSRMFGLWQWSVVVADVVARLAAMATMVAYFQSELAHAGYTARPVPTWPDSPAMEAIATLEARNREAGSGGALPL